MPAQIWFITGASSGFGLAMVKHVLAQGDVAIAAVRYPSSMSSLTASHPQSRLFVVKVDVGKPEEVEAVFALVKKEFGRIDVVFNNAGTGLTAEVEGTPLEVARVMFDTNFWGAANVSTQTVKFFRDVNKPMGGRLLVNTSKVAFNTVPTLGYYGASKRALESITEALQAEVKSEWGIKITMLEPGGFKTRGSDYAGQNIVPILPEYEGGITDRIRDITKSWAASGDIAKAARTIYEIAYAPNVPPRIPLGLDTALLTQKRASQLVEELAGVEKWSADLKLDNE